MAKKLEISRIPTLPPATPLTGDEVIYAVQNKQDVKTSPTQISAFITDQIEQGPTPSLDEVTAVGSSSSRNVSIKGITIGTAGNGVYDSYGMLIGGGNSLGALTGLNQNLAIGSAVMPGMTNGAFNVAIGGKSLSRLITGTGNATFGPATMSYLLSGSYNTAMGYGAGKLSYGSFNTFIGNDVMGNTGAGSGDTLIENTLIGYQSGRQKTKGNRNTYIGAQTGHNSNNSNGVYLGYGSGYSETADNQLRIANNTSNSLIDGDFSEKTVAINGAFSAESLSVLEIDGAVAPPENMLSWNSTTKKVERSLVPLSPVAPVTSVAGKTGVVTLVKGDVGLGSVDNTTDLNKPISTLTQTALNLKEPKFSPLASTYIPFSDGTTLTGSSNLTWNSSTNTLNVQGTGSQQIFRVGSFFSMSADGVLLFGNGLGYGRITWDTDKAIFSGQSDKRVSFGANNQNDQLVVIPGGNVGINTVTPSEKLEVNGNIKSSSLAGTGTRMVVANSTGVISTQEEIIGQKTISTATTLDNTFNGAIVKIKASATITIPSTLATDFNCVFRSFAGATGTFVAGAGVTLDAQTGLKLEPFKMATLFKDGATTTYVLTGETSI